jgi:GMP synthase-like glutamine amidotransferase
MKTGLLLCDHVKPPFLDIQGDYPDMFRAFLPELAFTDYDICRGHYPSSAAVCDVWITTGSVRSVYDDLGWIHWLKDFVGEIQHSGKKFVGTCFGHQMLAEALGGKVLKAQSGWSVGVHTFEVLHKASWMQPEISAFNLLMMCADQVVQLPPDSKVMASAPDCPVGMFTVGKNMLGIQAHPEFSVKYEKAVMDSRVQLIGVEKWEKANESLSSPVDQSLIKEWVLRFLEVPTISA